MFTASRGHVEACLEACLDSPGYARYVFVRVEAEADPKLYDIIKGVGLGLGLECTRATAEF